MAILWSRHRLEADLASELLDNFLRDNEAEPDSILVVLGCALDEPEQLEQLVLVLVRDADSSVIYRYLQILAASLRFRLQDLRRHNDASTLGELESIRLQIQQHLHDPLLVRVEERAEASGRLPDEFIQLVVALFLAEVREPGPELDSGLVSFLTLNAHDLLDSFSDVEWFDVGPEFTRLDLGVVQEVLNEEAHQLR